MKNTITTNSLPAVLKDFIKATNEHDGEAFIQTFANDAMVNDFARNFWGKAEIKKWSDKEMIGDKVTMQAEEIIEHYGDYLITALTDGNYDKKAAPDPTYLDYFFTLKEGKIVKMIVVLNKEKSIR
jgi:ketosteroid isomerase-like protein